MTTNSIRRSRECCTCRTYIKQPEYNSSVVDEFDLAGYVQLGRGDKLPFWPGASIGYSPEDLIIVKQGHPGGTVKFRPTIGFESNPVSMTVNLCADVWSVPNSGSTEEFSCRFVFGKTESGDCHYLLITWKMKRSPAGATTSPFSHGYWSIDLFSVEGGSARKINNERFAIGMGPNGGYQEDITGSYSPELAISICTNGGRITISSRNDMTGQVGFGVYDTRFSCDTSTFDSSVKSGTVEFELHEQIQYAIGLSVVRAVVGPGETGCSSGCDPCLSCHAVCGSGGTPESMLLSMSGSDPFSLSEALPLGSTIVLDRLTSGGPINSQIDGSVPLLKEFLFGTGAGSMFDGSSIRRENIQGDSCIWFWQSDIGDAYYPVFSPGGTTIIGRDFFGIQEFTVIARYAYQPYYGDYVFRSGGVFSDHSIKTTVNPNTSSYYPLPGRLEYPLKYRPVVAVDVITRLKITNPSYVSAYGSLADSMATAGWVFGGTDKVIFPCFSSVGNCIGELGSLASRIYTIPATSFPFYFDTTLSLECE